jgi:hypothetical protein
MKCPTCGINALATPKEYYGGPAYNRKASSTLAMLEALGLYCLLLVNVDVDDVDFVHGVCDHEEE